MAESRPLMRTRGALNDLSETSVRHGFIQKVYGILSAQLAFTIIIGGIVMQTGQSLMKYNPGLVMFLLFGSLAMSVVMMCVFMCKPGLMRQTPTNYVLLGLFTLAESVMVGFICTTYTQESVLICLAMTALVVVALTVFACQTKYDFTGMGPYLFAAIMVLLGLSLCLSIAGMTGLGASPAFKAVRLVYAALGALLFSVYIVYDTQLIVGGKHQNQFDVDDYAMGAISLYIDIIQLFLYLLELFGDRR